MAHKVGLGKPLGLGSVSIEIESIETINREIRYGSFIKNDNSFVEGKEDSNTDYINKFKIWMNEIFNKKFEDLENVKDLRKILEFGNKSEKPIHYPLCKDTDEEQFKWFVANRHSKNKHQVLPFPNDINGNENYLKRNEKPKK